MWVCQPDNRLSEALRAVTDHFAGVMAGPLISGSGVTFKDGVEGIPTIKQAREVLADIAQG